MSNLSDLFSQDAAAVLLNTDELAETVTHRPLGDASNDADVSGIVDFLEPAVEHERGRKVFQRGALDVVSTLSLHTTDRWKIRGIFYDTERIEPAEGGLVRLFLVNRTSETTTAGGRLSRR